MLFLVIITVVFVIIAHLSKKNKLRIIKYAVLVIGGGVITAAKCGVKAAKPFELPLKWLLHYISGSGKALQVPIETVKAAKSALFEAIRSHNKVVTGKYYCLYHSTLYEGAGFYGRPTLFYLVGGFTFLFRRDYTFSGKDQYDWHPNENGEYFTSPLGEGKWAIFFMAFLDLVFGNNWFIVGGFPSGQAGISNKLWDDLHLVGAKPFWSFFDKYDILTEEEKNTLACCYLNIFVQNAFCNHGFSGIRKIDGVTARYLSPDIGLNDLYYLCKDCYGRESILVTLGRFPDGYSGL